MKVVRSCMALWISVWLSLCGFICFAQDTPKPNPPAVNQPVVQKMEPKPVPDEMKSQQAILENLKKKQTAPAGPAPAQNCHSGSCTASTPPQFGMEPGMPIQTEEFQEMVDFSSVQRAVEESANPIVVVPEVPSAVKLSAKDINRITCQAGEIKDIVFSKEKGMTISFSGKDAYLKYKYIRKGGKILYPPVTEMFVICGDTTFNIIAVPEKIPSQTIRLSSGDSDRIKKNQSFLAGMSLEKKVLAMIKAVYTDDIPESFRVDRGVRIFQPFKDVDMRLNRTVTADGEGILLKEFILTVSSTSQQEDIEFDERDFLKSSITKNTLALSLDRLHLKRGESLRLFVCELKKDQDESLTKQSSVIGINRGYDNSGAGITRPETPEKTGPAGQNPEVKKVGK